MQLYIYMLEKKQPERYSCRCVMQKISTEEPFATLPGKREVGTTWWAWNAKIKAIGFLRNSIHCINLWPPEARGHVGGVESSDSMDSTTKFTTTKQLASQGSPSISTTERVVIGWKITCYIVRRVTLSVVLAVVGFHHVLHENRTAETNNDLKNSAPNFSETHVFY